MRVFFCKNILKKKPTLKTMWVFVDIYKCLIYVQF